MAMPSAENVGPGDATAPTDVDRTDDDAPCANQSLASTLPASDALPPAPGMLPDTVEDDPQRTIDYVARASEDTEASDTNRTALSSDRCDGPATVPPSRARSFRPGRGLPRDEVPGYELLATLGRGGMGVVYKARQLGLNRLVALKMIRDGVETSAESLERFQVEAEVVARLRHPNILQVYEVGTALGWPYVAFELLDAGTLAARIAATPQPADEAAGLLVTLARAIHAAHQAGVLHRDLKPSNVLFDRNGVPKIADFGLAKRLEVEEGQTRTGQIIGTPSYMAPEQAEGRVRDIGPAADLYALGAILYEMLTGRPPFKGETSAETLKLVLTEEVIPPSRLRPRIPRDLETICLKCLEREPRKRYADASALADDLERYRAGAPIAARRTPTWERAWKWVRRHPAATVLLVVGLAGLSAAAVYRQQAAERAQALRQQAAERAQRAAQHEEQRVAKLRHEVEDELFKAQTALAERRWDDARVLVTRPLSRAEREPRLADLFARGSGLLEQAERGDGAERAAAQLEARYRRFLNGRDEALFLDTRFTGLDTTVGPEAARRATEAALAVFMTGGRDGAWKLDRLPAGLSPQQQADVRSGCYELLMILADAVAQAADADPDGDPARRADTALRTLDQAVALRPAPTRAYHWRRAEYLELKGDAEAASAARTQAEALSPADAYDWFLSARARIRRGDWEGAVAELDAVLQQHPDHFWAQCLLAVAYMQLHEPLRARPSLNACLQQRRDAVWLYLLRGLANAQVGELALEAAERFPEKSGTLQAEAAAQFEAAESDYRDALDRLAGRPESAPLHYVLLVNRGQFRLQRGNLQAAEDDLRAAERLDGRRYEAPSALGRVFAKQRRIAEALEQCGRAIALRPGWPPLYRERAEILLGAGSLSDDQRAAALADLEQAIRFESPAQLGAIADDRTNQARLLHQGGRDDEALAACAAALEIAPRHAGAHRVRIQALLGVKRFDELVESCDVALRSGPPSADLYELRGMAHDAQGRHSRAIDDYTMALSFPPRTAGRLVRRGWAYLVQGAAGPARDDFSAALELDRANPDVYNGRGLALAHLGKHRDAVLDAEHALQRSGHDDWRTPYNAARVYAQAAAAASAEARRQGPEIVAIVAKYHDRAVELIALALERKPRGERAAWLRDTVLNDPVFQSLQRRLRGLSDN